MTRPGKIRGFTLIELMISMLLGLVIVGSVVGVMLSNKRSYRTNEGLTQVQESARTAYELLAHDLRQAAGTGCDRTRPPANVLVPAALWWQDWFGVTGYDSTQVDPAVAIGTVVGERAAGTDSIRVESMDSAGLSVSLHDVAARRIDIPAASTDLVAGDIILICDFDHSTIFQASSVTSASGTVSVYHNTGVGTPGNCSQGLGSPSAPPPCPANPGNVYTFPRNSQIGRLVITDWYVGNNGRSSEGGLSLYRRRVSVVAGVPTPVVEEIVAGVTDMEMQFRANADDSIIANASLVTDWSAISSVLVRVTARSTDAAVSTDQATNNGRVERTFNYLISLRNRLP